MKQIQPIASGANFSAINLGALNAIEEYVLNLEGEMKIPGKVFGGTPLGATGGEFSFQCFAPGTETGFLHSHKTHEELYFFLSGEGEMQVDGHILSVKEGSVVRVAPGGKRSIRNNSTAPLLMLCVQYVGNTFSEADAADGILLGEPVVW